MYIKHVVVVLCLFFISGLIAITVRNYTNSYTVSTERAFELNVSNGDVLNIRVNKISAPSGGHYEYVILYKDDEIITVANNSSLFDYQIEVLQTDIPLISLCDSNGIPRVLITKINSDTYKGINTSEIFDNPDDNNEFALPISEEIKDGNYDYMIMFSSFVLKTDEKLLLEYIEGLASGDISDELIKKTGKESYAIRIGANHVLENYRND